MPVAAHVDSARGSVHAAGMDRKTVQPSQNSELSRARQILARNLSALMDLNDLNQTELGRRSRVSQRHISDILNRRTDATGGVINKLAAAFGREGYELLIDGLDREIRASSGNLRELVSAYVSDPDIRRLLDAALGLTPPRKRP